MIELNDLHAQYLSIKDELDAAIASVVQSSAFIAGEPIARFEEHFSSYVGAKHCIGVGNGTDALEIIFEALDVVGRPVIVPAMTAAPTVEAVIRSGNWPLFVDVGPDCLLNLYQVEQVRETDAVLLPVHLYGRPVNMTRLLDIAQRNGWLVVEDCAQAHGALHAGQRVGMFGIAGAFSFYPSKNLGAWGDGGAIVTDDDALAARCRAIANHGRQGKFNHQIVGRNSRLDGLQAAILDVKLNYLDQWNALRQMHAECYDSCLQSFIPAQGSGGQSVYHQYPILVEDRAEFAKRLRERGVATGMHYPFILPELPPYAQYGGGKQFPHAKRLAEQELSIPVHEMLSMEQVVRVAASVLEVFSELS
jgi:dTDP-4-amino-4,6-dideoxygalactose transaminase